MISLVKSSRGNYIYKGHRIVNMGYYPPEKSVVWEATDISTGLISCHGYTLRECKRIIDSFED